MASAHPEPNKAAIYATTTTAFFAIAGIAVVDPILPAIGHAFGANHWQIAMLFTAYIGIMAIGMIPAIVATGKFGFKKVLATGVATVAVAATAAACAGSMGWLAGLRGLWGLGNSLFFATAMVLLLSLANDRAWAVELFEMCLGLGFAIGPLIGGLVGLISWRAPFLLCGLFMVAALVIALVKLKDPAARPTPVTVSNIFASFRRPAFIAVCVVTAAYNFVFFIVLGFTPMYLGLPMVALGLVFTGWGAGLATGIMVIGHRLAHRIGSVQTTAAAIVGLMISLAVLASSQHTAQSVAAMIAIGVCMGVCNANLTDLALAAGEPDRRTTTGAFNFVRWGFAAPAPLVAGWLAEKLGMHAPLWRGVAVLTISVLTFAVAGHIIARRVGERVFWAAWNAKALAQEGSAEEALGEF